MVSKEKLKLLLITILAIGVTLRLYNLDTNPPELFADEIANVLSPLTILKTGKDINGKLLPYFYTPIELISPIYGYLATPFVLFLGRNTWAVRLPAVILGTIAIYLTYKIFLMISKNIKIGILSGFILALLPWHIHYSRIGWQPAAELPFILLAIFFLLKYVKSLNTITFFLSVFAFALFLYTNRSAEFLSPVILLVLIFLNRKKFANKTKTIIIGLILYFILLTPFIYTALTQPELEIRAKRIFTFKEGISFQSLRNFSINYLSHFSLSFLFINGDPNLRHAAGGHGLCYWWMLPFLIIGFINTLKKIKKENFQFIIFWLLLYPIGGSLTNDGVPHATRTLIGIPVFCFFTAWGLVIFFNWFKVNQPKKIIYYGFNILLVGTSILEFLNFSYYYYKKYPKISAQFWEYGNKALFSWILKNVDYSQFVCINGPREVYTKYYLFDKQLRYTGDLKNEECENNNSIIVVPGQEIHKSEWVLKQNISDFNNKLIYAIYRVNK